MSSLAALSTSSPSVIPFRNVRSRCTPACSPETVRTSDIGLPVSLDKNGMMVSALEESGADIAYVTPSHQYPTGTVMPINRRMELLLRGAVHSSRLVKITAYSAAEAILSFGISAAE